MKVVDQETNEQVSRRELAQRLRQRAAERQQDSTRTATADPYAEWDPLGAARRRREHERTRTDQPPPPPAPPPPAPQPQPSSSYRRTNDELLAAWRRGEVWFDDHGNRNPHARYSLTREQQVYIPKKAWY